MNTHKLKITAILLSIAVSTGCATTAPQPTIGRPLAASGAQATIAATGEGEGVLATAAVRPLELHFLDVGQGDSTLIRCPDGSTILIDAGSLDGLTSSRKAHFLSHLRSMLETPTGPLLDVLVVTHPDRDHYNLLRKALEDIKVRHVIYGGEVGDYGNFESWIQAFVNKNQATSPAEASFDPVDSPNDLMDCGAADVWILAANVEAPAGAKDNFVKNSLSIVLRVAMGDFEAILTGDGTEFTENAILKNYESDQSFLKVDVLKLGHHGSRTTSNRRAWIEAVQPRAAIASAGMPNGHGHPSVDAYFLLPQWTENLSEKHKLRWCVGKKGCGSSDIDEAVYSTPFAGDLKVVTNGSGYQLSCEKAAGC